MNYCKTLPSVTYAFSTETPFQISSLMSSSLFCLTTTEKMGGKPWKNLAMRILTTPYRVICKAKDFYIRSIIDCANHTTYGRAAMTGSHLPRSYSTTSFGSNDSAAEDLRELIRANSTSRIGDLNISRAELELYIKQHMMRQTRSASVGMGRIDEDAPISDDRKVKSEGLRSKSYGGTSATNITSIS